MGKPAKLSDSSTTERLRRIRDMLLGKEPSLLTEMDRKLDLILSSLNQGKAVSFDISSAPVPATEQPPADIPK